MKKGYKHATPDQKKTILEVYQKSLSSRVAATAAGVTLNIASRYLKSQGIELSKSTGGACYRRIDEVRQWAAEGVALSEIARRIGTNHHRVSQFLKKHKIPMKLFRQEGCNNPAWKNGETTDKDGYVLVHQPTHPHCNRHGYVRKHRLVMEKQIGRLLLPTEVVHHNDDNPQNNDPDNLQLFSSNSEHLAETLRGKCPNWTEAGRASLRESARRRSKKPPEPIQQASLFGDPPSP
jgi:hypothetical protein